MAYIVPIYPDLQWYTGISDAKGVSGRCPHASVRRCPRYFGSVAVLGDVRQAVGLPPAEMETLRQHWNQHELRPTPETATSISGGDPPNAYSHFCPEVAFDTFRLFASSLIRFTDSIDRAAAERLIQMHPAPDEDKDWRYLFSHVEPLHYTNCSLYGQLSHQPRAAMSNITFNGPVTGNVNVAGQTVSAAAMSISLQEIIKKIDEANAPPEVKEQARSKLAEFISHPAICAILGGLAGTVR